MDNIQALTYSIFTLYSTLDTEPVRVYIETNSVNLLAVSIIEKLTQYFPLNIYSVYDMTIEEIEETQNKADTDKSKVCIECHGTK